MELRVSVCGKIRAGVSDDPQTVPQGLDNSLVPLVNKEV